MDKEWIFGKHAIREALRSEHQLQKVFLAEGLSQQDRAEMIKALQSQQVPYQWVPRSRLDQLASGGNHQGIVAQMAAYSYAQLEDCFERAQERGEEPFFLILDGIEDPHNLGSILRTADASGVHGVIIPKRRAVGLTPIVAKTSAGAIAHVPVVRVPNLNQLVEKLKQQGLWIVGSDGAAQQLYHLVAYDGPVGLVIGNEGSGIRPSLKKKCDYLVRLPMRGEIQSLNASVAAGVLMYEVLRSRVRL
jgi:23S rRNA (guanosine2251-2'-O)-methyltransferase